MSLLERLQGGMDPLSRVVAGRVPVEEAVAALARHRFPPVHAHREGRDGGCTECAVLRDKLDRAWDKHDSHLAAAAVGPLLERLEGRLPKGPR